MTITKDVEEFAEVIKNFLFDRIDGYDNMTAEDPLWRNRLRWSAEHTVIFINETLDKFKEENHE